MSADRCYHYHVSPSANRDSIREHGLDWTKMHPEQRSIANGWPGQPEAEGVFLTDPHIEDAHFFVEMGGGRRIDVWRVDVTGLSLEDGPDGWFVCLAPIEPSRLKLIEVWDTDEDIGMREVSPDRW